MKEIKKNKNSLGLLAFLLVLFLGMVIIHKSNALSVPSTQNNNSNQNSYEASSSAKFDDLDLAMDKVSGQMNSYISSLPAKNQTGPFFEKGAKEVLPFYSMPFTKFGLTLNPDKKGPLKNGGVLSLKGVINFNSESQQETMNFLSDCEKKYGKVNKCLNSEVYDVSRFGNVGVFVQVFRKDQTREKSLFGDYLVDEFYAANDLNISENQQRDFQLSWKIPADSKPGDYYLAFYLNSNKNFDIWGTPLTVFSFAQTFDFSLIPQDETKQSMGIELDKDNITINKLSYSYRKPAPTVTPDENGEVTVSLPISNLNSAQEKITVNYQLFSWGQTDPNNLITSKEESKTFSSGEKTNLSFTFKPDEKESVYNLKVVANGSNSKSISNVRFVMSNKNKGVFRFLGLAKKVQGKTYSPLICLRNASWEGTSLSKVKISVLDTRGNKKGSWSQDAKIASETRCFVPENFELSGNTCQKLVGEIFDENNNLLQKEEINYPCEKPDTQPSALDSWISSASSTDSNIVSEKSKVLLILGAILLVLIGIAVVLNNKKNKQ